MLAADHRAVVRDLQVAAVDLSLFHQIGRAHV